VLTSGAENAFVQSLIGRQNAWIGLELNGNTVQESWIDGTPVEYTNYLPWEPNGGHEECTTIGGSNGGGWSDMGCGRKASSVCELVLYAEPESAVSENDRLRAINKALARAIKALAT